MGGERPVMESPEADSDSVNPDPKGEETPTRPFLEEEQEGNASVCDTPSRGSVSPTAPGKNTVAGGGVNGGGTATCRTTVASTNTSPPRGGGSGSADPQHHSSPSPSSPSSSRRRTPSPVPLTEEEELLQSIQTVPARLWTKGSVIGHGGVKGSIVFRSAVAYKVAPRMNTSELRLIRALQDNPVNGLVTPFLVTLDPNGKIDGVVMPCLTCSLQELMMQAPPGPSSGHSQSVDDLLSPPSSASDATGLGVGRSLSPTPASGILMTTKVFRPVDSLFVLGCIAQQILVGLVELKYALPHTVGGEDYLGFSHNDLRLDNVLVDAATGKLLLCDYEQVGHYTKDHKNKSLCAKDRLLSAAYVPPAGAGSLKSDEWALGLLLLELFTGVQPLLDAAQLTDDFTYPLEALQAGFDWSSGCASDYTNFPSLRKHVHGWIRKLPPMTSMSSGRSTPAAVALGGGGGGGVSPSPATGTTQDGMMTFPSCTSVDSLATDGQTPNRKASVTVHSARSPAGSPPVEVSKTHGSHALSLDTNLAGAGGLSTSAATTSTSLRSVQDVNAAMADSFDSFMSSCLNRDINARGELKELLDHPWITMCLERCAEVTPATPTKTVFASTPEDVVRRWIHNNYRPQDLTPRTPAEPRAPVRV